MAAAAAAAAGSSSSSSSSLNSGSSKHKQKQQQQHQQQLTIFWVHGRSRSPRYSCPVDCSTPRAGQGVLLGGPKQRRPWPPRWAWALQPRLSPWLLLLWGSRRLCTRRCAVPRRLSNAFACAAGHAGPSSGRSHPHGLDFVGAGAGSEALPYCLICHWCWPKVADGVGCRPTWQRKICALPGWLCSKGC